MITKVLIKKILPIFKRQGVIKASLFGSVARGTATKHSDVDLLVNLRRDKTLLDLVRLQQTLEEKLGRKVDVVTYNALHPLLRDIILSEQ
ncbi:MAG: nucleotidyltransferase family protein, partial [bacterium]